MPSVRYSAQNAGVFTERQIPTVVHDEAAWPVEIGRAILLRRIEWIVAVCNQPVLVGERLAEGVGGLHRESVRELLARRDLKTVVIGNQIVGRALQPNRLVTQIRHSILNVLQRVGGNSVDRIARTG